jgi:hypothetical protein
VKVRLDENLPRGLKRSLPGHEVSTVTEVRWSEMSDAELLRWADERFDVPVTADRCSQSDPPCVLAVRPCYLIGPQYRGDIPSHGFLRLVPGHGSGSLTSVGSANP